MISREEALQKFKEIVGSAESWEQILQSQFTAHISLFQSWALREALFRVERAFQEFFLSTAVNESSIRSHAEDRDYLPRKASPSVGTIRIKNNGNDAVILLEGTPFQSENFLTYILTEPVTINMGMQSGDVHVSQKEKTEILHTVSEEKVYYEIIIPVETSVKINEYEVWVDETGDGDSYVKWSYSRLFLNTQANDMAFDEFYRHTGETGIRFGNGVFGKIPTLNSLVKIVMYMTDGDTYLLNGQPLMQVGDILDNASNIAKIEAKTSSVISGGKNMEPTEEISKNLHYWPVYKENIIWKDDFVYFIKKTFPTVLWANAWGEKEQIEATGSYSLDFINKIYITAYCGEGQDLSQEIMDSLNNIPRLNRSYEWVAPIFDTFDISVSGKVLKNRNIASVTETVKKALMDKYGLYSPNRTNDFNEHEAYALIQSTDLFNQQGEYFVVTHSDLAGVNLLNEVVGITDATLSISIGYNNG